jgi:rhamnulokinase
MDKKACSVAAVDIGAGSGKVFAVTFDGERIALREVYRFSSTPLKADGHLINDTEALYGHIVKGLESALALGRELPRPSSIGIDTFGNDYVLVRGGMPVLSPFNYRDTRASAMLRNKSREELFRDYRISGMPPASSLAHYRLLCDAEYLAEGERKKPGIFLMLPDYFGYRLTNEAAGEYTISSTTGLVDVHTRTWSESLLGALPFRRDYFLPLQQPGSLAGLVADSRLKTGTGPLRLARIPGHDSACAVLPIPMDKDALFLSSGSWFVFGMEAPHPYMDEGAFNAGISNQGFVNGKLRAVRPLPGLWFLQQCLVEWRAEDPDLDFNAIEGLAASYTGPVPYINIRRPEFSSPGDMLDKIRRYCRATVQETPDTVAAEARSIYAALALQCKITVGLLEQLSGIRHSRIYLVGGGARDSLLAGMIADATSLTVLAGIEEAAAAGNALMQLVALGQLGDPEQARQAAGNSFSFRVYEARKDAFWDEAMNKAIKIEGEDL